MSRLKPDTLFGDPIKAITNSATAKLPHVLGVDLGPQGYVIVRINKVAPPAKIDDEQRKQMSQQLARLMGSAEFESYLAGLKKDAKVEVYKQNLKKDATVQ